MATINKTGKKNEKLNDDAKPIAQVAKSDAERETEFLADRMADIAKQYKNVTADSIRRETSGHHSGKLTVEITCRHKKRDPVTGETHECGNLRRVATSDLFQVKFCEDCIGELRLAKRRRKAKQARAANKVDGGDSNTAVATKPKTKTKTKEKAKEKEKAKLLPRTKKMKMRPVEEKKIGEEASQVPDEGSVDVAVNNASE